MSSRDTVETDVIEEGSEALAVTGAGGGGGGAGAVVRSGGAGGAGGSGKKSVLAKMVEGIPGFAGNASYVTRKLLVSTGNAAWIVVTTGLVLALPLIIEMDREAQLVEVRSCNRNERSRRKCVEESMQRQTDMRTSMLRMRMCASFFCLPLPMV